VTCISFGEGKKQHDSDYSNQDDVAGVRSPEEDYRQLMIIDVSDAHYDGKVWTDVKKKKGKKGKQGGA
jgi:hypothetical protein